MTETPKTTTDSEAIAAGDRLGMHPEVVIRLMDEIRRRREPGYEPGEIYEDPSGGKWCRMRRSASHPDADPGWRCCESGTFYGDHVPKRPLRKLAPEGPQSAEVWWSSVLAALIAAEKHGEDRWQTAHRICRVLEGSSDD